MPNPSDFTIGMQIGIVAREIGKRREVYPRQIAAGKMSAREAALQIAGMQAVLKTLELLEDRFRGDPQ